MCPKKTATKKKKNAEEKVIKARLRIKLQAYDHKVIDNSAQEIIDIAARYGAETIGPIPLCRLKLISLQ